MKYLLRWTGLALRDLIEIKAYIQRDNPAAARKEAQKIKRSVEKLMRFPLAGRLLKKIPQVRQIVVSHYHIFYRCHGHSVEILRIYHQSRDI